MLQTHKIFQSQVEQIHRTYLTKKVEKAPLTTFFDRLEEFLEFDSRHVFPLKTAHKIQEFVKGLDPGLPERHSTSGRGQKST